MEYGKLLTRYERIIGTEEARRHKPKFRAELMRVKAYRDAMQGMLDELVNEMGVKIITAEDPVEYEIEGIMQCSINTKVGLTFDDTLKAIVRQDPDILLVGEIRH